jgi:hypothetical protein
MCCTAIAYCRYGNALNSELPYGFLANCVFWDVTHAACLTYSSPLKLEGAHSSETSVNLYQIIRRHIPEDSTLYSDCRKNLKFYFPLFLV